MAIAELAPRVGVKVATHSATSGFDGVTEAGASAFIVVATQGAGDDEALAAALRSPARYVAFVGSKAKVDRPAREPGGKRHSRRTLGRVCAGGRIPTAR